MKNLKKLLILMLILIMGIGMVSAANETETIQESPTEEVLEEPAGEILSATEEDVLSATVKFTGTTFADLNLKINDLNSGDTLELEKDVYATLNDATMSIGADNIVIDGKNHKIDGKKDGNNWFVVFGKSVTLKNINFVNFLATDNPFRFLNEKCSVINCNFTNNEGDYFLLNVQSDNAVFKNCNFIDNTIIGSGKVLELNGYGASLTGCNFKNTYARDGSVPMINLRAQAGKVSDCNFNSHGLTNFNSSAQVYSSNFIDSRVVWRGTSGNLGGCNFTNSRVIWYGDKGSLTTSNFQITSSPVITWMGSQGEMDECNFINSRMTEDFIKWEGTGGKIYRSAFPNIGKTFINSVHDDLKVINSWFSNTMENYNVTPSVKGFNLTSWLVLILDCSEGNGILSLDNKYDASTDALSKVSTRFPTLTFELTPTNANLNKDKLTIAASSAGFQYTISDRYATITAANAAASIGVKFTTELYDLQELINQATGDIRLTRNYTHDGNFDGKNPIVIDKPICIDGNGHSINILSKSQIFKITADNVIIKNITFLNGYGGGGGAIEWNGKNGTVEACNFTNNYAFVGGAIYFYQSSKIGIINCIFTQNTATNGAAISFYNVINASVANCRFNSNNAAYGAAVNDVESQTIITDSYFKGNNGHVIRGDRSSTELINNSVDTYDNYNAVYYENSNVFLDKNNFTGIVYVRGQIMSNVNIIVLNNESRKMSWRCNLTAVILDDNNNTVNYDNVSFVLPNSTRLKANVDNNGLLSYEIEFVKSGTYLIGAQSNLADATVLTGEVMVGDEFKLNLDMSSSIDYGDVLLLNITSPVDGSKNVTVILDSNVIKSIRIADSPTILELHDLTAGMHEITVSYEGDDRYLANTVAQNVAVNKIAADMNVDIPQSIDYGWEVILTVTLNDDASGNIVVRLNGEIISNSTQRTVPLDVLNAGNYTVNVTYEGDDNYNSCSKSYELAVNKVDPGMVVEIPQSVDYGQGVTVRVTLDDGATGNVTIALDGVVIVNSSLRVFELPVLSADNYMVNVSYLGDENYNPESKSYELAVNKVDPGMVVEIPQSVDYGQGVTVRVTLDDGATGNVTIALDGVVIVNSSLRVFELPVLSADNYMVNVSYLGDENYNPESKSYGLAVNKINPNIDIDVPSLAYYGETVVLTVTLNGDALGNVTVMLNGREIANHTGSIQLSGLIMGVNEVEVNYSGDENYNLYFQSYNITVNKLDSQIILNSKLSVLASDTKAGEKGSPLNGVLKDVNGNAIAGVVISIKVNGKQINVKTDSKGKFSFKATLANAKTYDVIFSFAGSDEYSSTTKTVKLKVTKKKTKIKAKSKKFKKNKVKKLKVRLTSIKNPVNGKKYLKKVRLTLKIKGKTYKAKTNKNGYATFKIKISKRGKYKAVVRFKGDNTYAKSSKKIKITIK